MQQITLQLSVDEVNVVLEGLGNLPFAKVYALIGRIQEQAAQQLRTEAADKPDGPGGSRLAPAGT